jgi:serine/threonine-protein kinase
MDRFRREILVSAGLQHPHIVPVLSAGEMQGVPYYTMPYLEGETLRTRLARRELIPFPEVVRILHDVVDALAHAHERGIVHRDIKPDNILLSGRHAVVLDFGVAKALSESRHGGGVDEPELGLVIGTPAYMAPEQAAGDPETDHRADLYAFGILGYEMLALVPPFADRTPQEMIAAHIDERPTPILELRPGAPPALARLVMRCLEKHPADRPASAAEIRAELEGIATPDIGSMRASAGAVAGRRRWAGTAILGTLTAAVAGAAFFGRPTPPPVDEQLVAITPFHVLSADPALGYLREGMLDLLSAKLTGVGGPRAADPRALLSAWRRAAGSDSAELPRERALALAERLGAGRLLTGYIAGSTGRIVINATIVDVDDGRARAQATVQGPVDSIPQLVDQLTAQLLAVGAGEGERLGELTSTSLAALRHFLAGQWYYRRGRYRDAARAYSTALDEDSTFALAGVGLVAATRWFGDPAAGARGMRLARANRDRLGEGDRAWLDAMTGPPSETPPTLAELHAAKERFLSLAPDRPDAWFELGDWLLHVGDAIGIADAHVKAAAALERTIALDSTFAPAVEHLVLIEAASGDTASVRRLARLYASIDSAGENLDGVRWRAAVALGDTAALDDLLRRRGELTPAASHTIAQIALTEAIDLDRAAAVLEAGIARAATESDRFWMLIDKHDLELNRGRPAAALAVTREYPAAGAPGYDLRERLRDALFADGDTIAAYSAARELARRDALPLPEDGNGRAVRLAERCMLELWRVAHDDTTATRRAIASLPADATCGTMLETTLAVRARRADAPVLVERLDSLLRMGPGAGMRQIGNLVVARHFEELGQPDRALAAVRRREYFIDRPVFLSTYLREEGRLAALTGDREGAIRAYRRYVALRADPEPSLAEDVAAVRTELRRLERESAGS